MPILCRVTRGELTESIHVAFAVAVDETGHVFFSSGDPYYLTCIRSSLKPFQAAAAIQAGVMESAQFSQKELALMCASHKGEKTHVDTANGMIEKLGLTQANYECGVHYPSDIMARRHMIRDGIEASPLHNNCSGKHAGMLALAKHLGQGTSGYIKRNHPVQETIFDYVQKLTGLESIPTEIDGCSAPTPFFPLETIAKLFLHLSDDSKPELKTVFDAMCAHPEMVGGTNHFDSMFIGALKGRGVTKVGGESVRGIAIKKPDGGRVGIAIKILDGNFRAMSLVAMKVCEHLALLFDDELDLLDKFRAKILKNHNEIDFGKIEVTID